MRKLRLDASMSRTPIGRVTFRCMRNGDVVAEAFKRGARRGRVFATHEDNAPIWAVLYGKAPLEAPRFNAMMARKRYEAEREKQRLRALEQRAFHADAARVLRKHPDLVRLISATRAN